MLYYISYFVLDLIERNPENSSYYKGLESCCNLETIEVRQKIYSDVLEQQPRASLPKKLPLTFLTG